MDLNYLRKFQEAAAEDGNLPYDTWVRYQQSKLGDLLLAKAFWRFEKIESASVHPGLINTELGRSAGLWENISFMWKNWSVLEWFKSVQQGASTTVFVAATPNLENGAYYADCAVKQPAACATYEEDCKALYDYCNEITLL